MRVFAWRRVCGCGCIMCMYLCVRAWMYVCMCVCVDVCVCTCVCVCVCVNVCRCACLCVSLWVLCVPVCIRQSQYCFVFLFGPYACVRAHGRRAVMRSSSTDGSILPSIYLLIQPLTASFFCCCNSCWDKPSTAAKQLYGFIRRIPDLTFAK